MPPAAEAVYVEDPARGAVRDEPGDGGRRRGVVLRAPAAAALLTAALLCLATRLSRTYPFGPVTRNIVDLGQQYLPFHAYWRSFLLGETHGDAFLNWNSGFGANFLGDIGTYLSSPFDLLVVLFPADRVELALYVVTAAKITAAAAAMALLLLRLRPGPWPVAAVLGTAYALSGWTFNYGATVPMWLDGLVAFPLLCLVGEWARTGRRPVLGPLVVALAWIANFYTAYMATIGAAVVLAVRLLTAEETAGARQRLAGALRAAGASSSASGSPRRSSWSSSSPRRSPTPPGDHLRARALDGRPRPLPARHRERHQPRPLHRHARPRARADAALQPGRRTARPGGWTAAIVLVTLSLQWEPTHLLWHAGASPNGIPYRQTFVLCGLLLIGAWFSAARGVPRRRRSSAARRCSEPWRGRPGERRHRPVDLPRLRRRRAPRPRRRPRGPGRRTPGPRARTPDTAAVRRPAARVLPVLAVILLVAAQAARRPSPASGSRNSSGARSPGRPGSAPGTRPSPPRRPARTPGPPTARTPARSPEATTSCSSEGRAPTTTAASPPT
ncbi:YfhO family protein [Streptomyces diastatochromogenes]|nr:YfhO family protein [Streptomyces diastatochromogenes]